MLFDRSNVSKEFLNDTAILLLSKVFIHYVLYHLYIKFMSKCKIFNLYSTKTFLNNPTTGTIVFSTGIHGDKTKGYQFLAFTFLPTTKTFSSESTWFRKGCFHEMSSDQFPMSIEAALIATNQ